MSDGVVLKVEASTTVENAYHPVSVDKNGIASYGKVCFPHEGSRIG